MGIRAGVAIGMIGCMTLAGLPAQAQTMTILHAFTGGADGSGGVALKQHGDVIYGTSSAGAEGGGIVFQIALATGVVSVVYSPPQSLGQPGTFSGFRFSDAPTVEGNLLFGTTYYGGPYGSSGSCYKNCGTVYKIDLTSGTATVIHGFNYPFDGANPSSDLIDYQGDLYGTTGGASQAGYTNSAPYAPYTQDTGTTYKIDARTGAETTLHVFTGSDGSGPGDLTRVGNILYGPAVSGGITTGSPNKLGFGTVFALDLSTGYLTVPHMFTGGADGAYPNALAAAGGLLFGTTRTNISSPGAGTVFQYDPKHNTSRTIYTFTGGADGKTPSGALHYLDGALYGVTSGGGASGAGTLFKVDAGTGAETVLYSFDNAVSGSRPYKIIYANGAFYGSTQEGGSGGAGTLFEFQP